MHSGGEKKVKEKEPKKEKPVRNHGLKEGKP